MKSVQRLLKDDKWHDATKPPFQASAGLMPSDLTLTQVQKDHTVSNNSLNKSSFYCIWLAWVNFWTEADLLRLCCHLVARRQNNTLWNNAIFFIFARQSTFFSLQYNLAPCVLVRKRAHTCAQKSNGNEKKMPSVQFIFCANFILKIKANWVTLIFILVLDYSVSTYGKNSLTHTHTNKNKFWTMMK